MFGPIYDIKHALAGSGDLLFHWGFGIAAIILCGVGAWLSPVFKKDFLYTGCVIAVALVFEAVGVHDEAARCSAQQQVVIKYVEKAVTKAKKAPAARSTDRWDNPRN